MSMRDVVKRTHPRSTPLAMLTMIDDYFYACVWFCSYSYGALLGGSSGRRSSAINRQENDCRARDLIFLDVSIKRVGPRTNRNRNLWQSDNCFLL